MQVAAPAKLTVPAAHTEQVSAAVAALPAAQVTQEVVPPEETLPDPQEEDEPFPLVEVYLPATQFEQVLLPAAFWNFPVAQASQSTAPVAGLYVPIAQFEHTVAPVLELYFPIGQDEHPPPAWALYFPAAQL